MKIQYLTIYCSHSDNISKDYFDLAQEIGTFLGEKKISIVYGGGNTGLMGKVSNSALKNGSEVIGIIPEFLKITEKINFNISETIVVKNMNERKKLLYEKGEAFLILPGGSGTIEEATEIISWKFLNIHTKPIIIFDYKNFWKSLYKLYEDVDNLKFANKNLQSISINIKTIEEFKSIFA